MKLILNIFHILNGNLSFVEAIEFDSIDEAYTYIHDFCRDFPDSFLGYRLVLHLCGDDSAKTIIEISKYGK